MQNVKAGVAHSSRVLPENPLVELNRHVSKVAMLVELYEKHANSELRDEGELGHVQQEMKVIRNGILSELAHSKSVLQKLQREAGAV